MSTVSGKTSRSGGASDGGRRLITGLGLDSMNTRSPFILATEVTFGS